MYKNSYTEIISHFFLRSAFILTFVFTGLSRRFGTLPYLPFAWLVYSVFLVFKVGIIFTTYVSFFQTTSDNYKVELFQNLSNTNCSIGGTSKPFDDNESVLELGPNLLKLAVGSTALVFIIILQVFFTLRNSKPISLNIIAKTNLSLLEYLKFVYSSGTS